MARTLCAILSTTILLIVVFATPVAGQGPGPGSVFAPSSEPLNPMASEWGVSGLWKVISAETPPAKSFGMSGWYDRINRNPGFLTITTPRE